MKILILATPRSGSTSLTKFIDSHIELPNYKMFMEPYNDSNYKDYFDIKVNATDQRTVFESKMQQYLNHGIEQLELKNII